MEGFDYGEDNDGPVRAAQRQALSQAVPQMEQ